MAWKIPSKNANKVQDSVESISEMLDSLGIKNYKINPQTLVVDVDGNVKLDTGRWSDGKLAKLGIYEIPCKFGKIKGNFNVRGNRLTSLEGCPHTVGGYFSCFNNNLTSLEGAPSKVGGDFICDDNRLISLEGAPSKVGGDFSCSHNGLANKYQESDVRALCDIGGNIYVENYKPS